MSTALPNPAVSRLLVSTLFGKRYSLEKFGIDVKVVWLPDSLALVELP